MQVCVSSPVFAPWLKVAQSPSSHKPGAQDANMLVQRDQLQPWHLTTKTKEGGLQGTQRTMVCVDK